MSAPREWGKRDSGILNELALIPYPFARTSKFVERASEGKRERRLPRYFIKSRLDEIGTLARARYYRYRYRNFSGAERESSATDPITRVQVKLQLAAN